MVAYDKVEKEYKDAIRYGTIIFRLDNEQTNSRLDIIEYEGSTHYYHLYDGRITDTDIIGPTSAIGHVVTFDKEGTFGRSYVRTNPLLIHTGNVG